MIMTKKHYHIPKMIMMQMTKVPNNDEGYNNETLKKEEAVVLRNNQNRKRNNRSTKNQPILRERVMISTKTTLRTQQKVHAMIATTRIFEMLCRRCNVSNSS